VKALALLFCLLVPSAALATDRSLPFELLCPDTKRCTKSESGSWIPAWYGREMAQESAYLEGAREELERASRQVAELRLALEASQREAASLKLSVVAVEDARRELQEKYAKHDRRITRRTRWAIGATVLCVVLAGALGAGIYVVGH